MSEPYYAFDRFGSLCFFLGDTHRVHGEADLAILFSADPDMPCLFKHGRVESVSAYADKIRAIEPEVQTVIIPIASIRNALIGPRILEEINACLRTSGRVATILRKAQKLTLAKWRQ